MNYEILCPWGKREQEEFVLAQKIGTKQLVVQKEIEVGQKPIYERLMQIDHENLVKVMEVTTEGGKNIVTEEFVHGMTLAEWIEENGTLNEEKACRFLGKLCEGVEQLHNAGIIHRDLNPNNIMVTAGGNIKICDFGISRIYKEGARKDTNVLGTEGFTAPEQFGYQQTDFRSDIYSLGVVLYYMLTGRTQLGKVKGVSAQVNKVIRKSTSSERQERYKKIQQMEEELTGQPVKRNSLIKGIFKGIPGFRSRSFIKASVASIGYPLIIFCDVYGIIDYEYTIGSSDWEIMIRQVFLLVIPFILYTNTGHVWNRLLKMSYIPRGFKAVLRVLFAVTMQLIALLSMIPWEDMYK